MEIDSEYRLISTIKILAEAKKEYDKVKYALEEVKRKGYGIVTPMVEEMKLEEPVIVKHGSKFGVKLKASAPSIHLIRADIETEDLTYNMKLEIKKDKGTTRYEVEYRLNA